MGSYKNIKPIFIGGCPRSGTTFLGSLLGKGDKTVVVPESQFKIQEYKEIRDNLETVFYNIKKNYRFKI